MTRKKFVPLFTEGGTENRVSTLLPGRHPCQCLAVRHRLIANCISCGRIVCEQEGSGSCYFCGNLVVSAAERKLIDRDSNSGRKLKARLQSSQWAPGTPTPPWVLSRPSRKKNKTNHHNKQVLTEDECLVGNSEVWADDPCEDEDGEDPLPDTDAQTRLEEGLVHALLQRDRLLHFDATTAKRTKVIDDELDYFVSEASGVGAVWLDPETRKRVAERVEALRAQRQAMRSQSFGFCIDFSNMTVTEEAVHPEASEQFFDAEEDVSCQQGGETTSGGISDPLLDVPTPQFVVESFAKKVGGSSATGDASTKPKSKQHGSGLSRVQDNEQQRILDRGFCLSMHQPWASLLVRGVKIHEGRSWYSAHRGPLWIAAAAKVPNEEEVRAVEEEYLERGARKADLPTSYPVGVLVGCVNVDDVLPQKEYRTKFPQGESNSPYVFVCSDPRELLIKLPLSGQHKIYKLDPHIHAAAKENLT
uniref:Activating signal cointegrator 1 n=1 Tax=Mesocestoides corti TaxID=53468 RepID=A0A5K3EI41_MESCO